MNPKSPNSSDNNKSHINSIFKDLIKVNEEGKLYIEFKNTRDADHDIIYNIFTRYGRVTRISTDGDWRQIFYEKKVSYGLAIESLANHEWIKFVDRRRDESNTDTQKSPEHDFYLVPDPKSIEIPRPKKSPIVKNYYFDDLPRKALSLFNSSKLEKDELLFDFARDEQASCSTRKPASPEKPNISRPTEPEVVSSFSVRSPPQYYPSLRSRLRQNSIPTPLDPNDLADIALLSSTADDQVNIYEKYDIGFYSYWHRNDKKKKSPDSLDSNSPIDRNSLEGKKLNFQLEDEMHETTASPSNSPSDEIITYPESPITPNKTEIDMIKDRLQVFNDTLKIVLANNCSTISNKDSDEETVPTMTVGKSNSNCATKNLTPPPSPRDIGNVKVKSTSPLQNSPNIDYPSPLVSPMADSNSNSNSPKIPEFLIDPINFPIGKKVKNLLEMPTDQFAVINLLALAKLKSEQSHSQNVSLEIDESNNGDSFEQLQNIKLNKSDERVVGEDIKEEKPLVNNVEASQGAIKKVFKKSTRSDTRRAKYSESLTGSSSGYDSQKETPKPTLQESADNINEFKQNIKGKEELEQKKKVTHPYAKTDYILIGNIAEGISESYLMNLFTYHEPISITKITSLVGTKIPMRWCIVFFKDNAIDDVVRTYDGFPIIDKKLIVIRHQSRNLSTEVHYLYRLLEASHEQTNDKFSKPPRTPSKRQELQIRRCDPTM